METRDINEIRSAIKYMDYKPVLLSKFYDVKKLIVKKKFWKMKHIIKFPVFCRIREMIIRL